MNLATKALIIASLAATATLAGTLGLATVMHTRQISGRVVAESPAPEHASNPSAAAGHALFLANCAHCHAEDATGDEGPDLHGVKKSDDRIANLIKSGIKGEMPRFGEKFSEEQVRALVAYLRSLTPGSSG